MGSAGAHERWPIWTSTFIPLSLRRCRHLVVVSAHLGEDVCAVGGLIATLADRDVRIDLLAVTEDDGSPPGETPTPRRPGCSGSGVHPARSPTDASGSAPAAGTPSS